MHCALTSPSKPKSTHERSNTATQQGKQTWGHPTATASPSLGFELWQSWLLLSCMHHIPLPFIIAMLSSFVHGSVVLEKSHVQSFECQMQLLVIIL
jgi:hypothetical protein